MPKRAYVVLGLGSIGLRHARNLLALGRTVVGFDPDDARCARLVEGGGLIVKNRDDALACAAKGHAILIATPSAAHREDLLDVLPLASPVFVEKPMATRLDDIGKALAQARAPVLLGHNQRFNPAVAKARALLSSGRLGAPLWARAICASYMPHWRPGQDYRLGYAADPYSGGVIFDIIHELDLLYHLLGPFETIGAWARRSGTIEIAAEDIADIVLRHASALQSTIHLDYVTRPAIRTTEITCARGRITIDVQRRAVRAEDTSGAALLEHVAPGTVDDDYCRLIEHFVACAEDGAEPACPASEGFAVLTETIRARRMAGLPQA
ncbi:MAG: Gfo/Idh/MocA family protein [Alphaproteobacteria bacterium]